jgi:Domain of unknown function (DUF4281)
MSPYSIFQLCNTIALASWIILIVISPFWLQVDKFLIGVIITLFCIVYTWLLILHFHVGDAVKFGSLNGVMELFGNPALLTAGWVHYLAFDLMTGIWIKNNSLKLGISHWLVIPCLILTFMLGPAGLLLYLLIRWQVKKQYFANNR